MLSLHEQLNDFKHKLNKDKASFIVASAKINLRYIMNQLPVYAEQSSEHSTFYSNMS